MIAKFNGLIAVFFIALIVLPITMTIQSANASIAPTVEWQKVNTRTLSNSAYSAVDESMSVIQTSDDGFLLVGALNDRTYVPHTGGVDNRTSVLIKISSSGEKQWEKQYSEITYPYFALQTADSGYLMVGSQLGSYNIVMKLDAQGNFQWSKNYSIQFSSGIQSSDENYILAGYVIGENLNMDVPAIVKISTDGSLIWNKTYPSPPYSFASSILENSDGNLLVVGRKDGAWFAQLDSEGNLLTNHTYSELNGFFNTILKSTDGGFVLVGGSFINSNEQPLIAHIDSYGVLNWYHLVDNPFGENGVSWSISATVLKDGNYVMVVVPDLEGSAIFMFNASGKEIWNTTNALNEEPPTFYKVTSSTDGGFAVAGTQNNSVSLIKYSIIETPMQPLQELTITLIFIALICAVIIICSLVFYRMHQKKVVT